METNEFAQTIVNALSKRDFVYQRATNAIAGKIDFVFEAIIEYLNENAQDILWDSIDFNNDLLVIAAKLPTQNSTQQRVLSIGIPIAVVQLQSKEEILKFFSAAEQSRAHRQAELERMMNPNLSDRSPQDASSDDMDEDVDIEEDLEDNSGAAWEYVPTKRVLH